jgi:hypothetical protein
LVGIQRAEYLIRRWIAERGWGVGTRLPSERDLAQQSGEGLYKVRIAVQRLVDAGILERPSLHKVVVRQPLTNPTPDLGTMAVVSPSHDHGGIRPFRRPTDRLMEAFRFTIERRGGHVLQLNPRLGGDALLSRLQRHVPDGVVIACGPSRFHDAAAALDRLVSWGVPTVVLADEWPIGAVSGHIGHVEVDHGAGAAAAAAALRAAGCTQVAAFALPQRNEAWVTHRRDGWPADAIIIPSIPTGDDPSGPAAWETAAQAQAAVMAPLLPTGGRCGFLLVSDAQGFIVQRALRILGRVGQDLLAGFDHYAANCLPQLAWEPLDLTLSISTCEEAVATASLELLQGPWKGGRRIITPAVIRSPMNRDTP